MRVLYHHRTQAEDGQAVHIRAMLRAFRDLGHAVREEALVRRGLEDPTRLETAPSRRGRSLPGPLRELLEHAYSLPAGMRLVRAGRSFGAELLYERHAFGNQAGAFAARRLGIPQVLEVNSPMTLELAQTRGLAFPRLALSREHEAWRAATLVCPVTEVLAEQIRAAGVPEERILVTHNGVDLADWPEDGRERARSRLGLDPAGPLLGFVGWVRDWHRLELLLECLTQPELLQVELVLLGDGPALPALRAQAAGAGLLQRVHFLGARPHAEVKLLVPAFDIALVPAINPYASPLKLFEYMAAGLPVIAPDQPNLREVLSPAEDALLVPPGSREALLEALRTLIGDQTLRRRLGRAARAKIIARDLTWQGNVRRIADRLGLEGEVPV